MENPTDPWPLTLSFLSHFPLPPPWLLTWAGQEHLGALNGEAPIKIIRISCSPQAWFTPEAKLWVSQGRKERALIPSGSCLCTLWLEFWAGWSSPCTDLWHLGLPTHNYSGSHDSVRGLMMIKGTRKSPEYIHISTHDFFSFQAMKTH